MDTNEQMMIQLETVLLPVSHIDYGKNPCVFSMLYCSLMDRNHTAAAKVMAVNTEVSSVCCHEDNNKICVYDREDLAE